MKIRIALLAACTASLLVPVIGHADQEFYGKLESRPDGKTGAWTVGGRQFDVTPATDVEEDHGLLKVGNCVEVEFEGNMVEEIESKPMSRCR
jgi:hypothetical protein